MLVKSWMAAGMAILSAAALGLATGAMAAGDPVAGERAFKSLCGLCHTTARGARSPVGPNLHGIFGAPAGRVEGFLYSRGHRESGLVFDAETLESYLADYQASVPGTKKSISGIRNAQKRADVIAYLRQATE
jgi:cytochrome c